MANTVSRIKNTDTLAQWSEKINSMMDSIDGFITSVGSFSSSSPTTNDLIIYSGGWKNKTLIAGDIIFDGSYSNTTQFKFKLDPLAISSKTEITSVDAANDFLMIWDATDSALKKIKPANISSQVGGSNTQIQFNDSGSLAGDSGLTYNKTTDTLTIAGGLIVDTLTLVVNDSTNRVGIVNSTPSYPLDITGDVNSTGTYRIGGSALFNSATSLSNTVTSSSLTSVGTLSSLIVSGSATFQTSISALSLSVTNTITGSISGNAGTVTNGVYTTGSYSDPSWITTLAGSKISGNISGNAANITAYTINQNLGTSNSPTFAGLTVSSTISGNITGTASINAPSASMSTVTGTQSVVAGGVYSINITTSSQTLTLPTTPPTGSKISFYPISSSISSYTIARGGTNTIMGLSENLVVDLKVPFDLIYNGSTWILA